jgi:hypothetical protein
MSRNAVATELTELIEQLQDLSRRAERLASSSGGLVDPGYFRACHTAAVMAAGDLDSKGLLLRKVEA